MSEQTAVTNDDLQAFADGALPPTRSAEVAAYLQDHLDAADYVRSIADQNAALRSAARPLLVPDVPSNLRVARLFKRQRIHEPSWMGRLAYGARPQIAAALVTGLLAGAAGGWTLKPSTSPFQHGVRPLVEEAADTYAVFEPDRLHPVEVAATDKDALMRWTTDRLRRPISAPDTIGSYGLLGGRVVPTSRGPAAMFMYEASGHRRIVLMICPLSLHGTAPITASAQDKLTGVSWSDQGVGYSLVGPLSQDRLTSLGEDVRRHEADKA